MLAPYPLGMLNGVPASGTPLRDRIARNLARFTAREAADVGLRHAAVAVAILADGPNMDFVLTLRGSRLNTHAGQYALPGGRLDPDETIEGAALRELSEEVGVDLGPESVLGRLDDFASRSGHRISPVVVWAGADQRLRPNPDEVADAYRVPLADLDRPGNPHVEPLPGSDRPVIWLSLLDTAVYAPTAAILYQFHQVALLGLDTRVDHFEQPRWAWR